MNPNSIVMSFTVEAPKGQPKIPILDLARKVRQLFPDHPTKEPLYIAGGACMASLIPEYQTTDIDVFLPRVQPPNVSPSTWTLIKENTKSSIIEGLSTNYHTIKDDILFDLVFMPNEPTIFDVFSLFDIFLSKCAYDVINHCYIIDQFCQEDLKNKTITVDCENDKTQGRAKKYLSRLPGWTIVR